MIYENEAKSILLKHKRVDSWFLSMAGMNLYRGCMHNCAYCDGRDEKYQVQGEFGQDVVVKVNAPELLKKELDPQRKRVPLKPGYIIVGGGVGDCYQPAEQKYKLTRKALAVISEYNLPVHVLTKSCLVERDFDILKKLNETARVIVSMSFSTVNDNVSRIFEPGTSLPSQRLQTLQKAKKNGLATGMFLMPVIPCITDSSDMIEADVRSAKNSGVDFVVFGGMTLKPGRQKEFFMEALRKDHKKFQKEYAELYSDSPGGNVSAEYENDLSSRFHTIAREYKIPQRIPPYLYKDMLTENDRVAVMLEHLDYLMKMAGRKSPYGFAAHTVAELETPISRWRGSLQQLKGVGEVTERIILDILDTKSSTYLESLL
jgi:DNA repair photolyase